MKTPTINFHLADCMEFMRALPDKAYDLAIVDPPYGIGEDGRNNHTRGGAFGEKKNSRSKGKAAAKDYRSSARYDNQPPTPEYFAELKRISKHQIIWGANHFIENFPFDKNASCWIVWNKMTNGDFADFEMAWASMPTSARLFPYKWNGMMQQDMKNKEVRQHPNQKPVALYKWLLTNYAKPGHRILDTHGGSMSIAIACYDLGFDLDICELDPDYYQAGTERFHRHVERWHKGMAAPITDQTDYSNLGGIFAPAPNDCTL